MSGVQLSFFTVLSRERENIQVFFTRSVEIFQCLAPYSFSAQQHHPPAWSLSYPSLDLLHLLLIIKIFFFGDGETSDRNHKIQRALKLSDSKKVFVIFMFFIHTNNVHKFILIHSFTCY